MGVSAFTQGTNMFKKVLGISVWFATSLSTLTLAMVLYLGTTKPTPLLVPLPTALSVLSDSQPRLLYGALPNPLFVVRSSLTTADARAEILRQYLERYDSPLEPLAQLLVEVADQNDFDYRWMVAIAQQESNLCKRIPENSHNCWGWGIYGDKVTRFDSYESAVRAIAPQFKDIFLKHTEITPEEVMRTYTPPSDGSWAFGVNQFMGELE